jgi:hypothetical protein
MKIEDIIRIKEQLSEKDITPLILDYHIIHSDLYEIGYRGDFLYDLSLTRLKSRYVRMRLCQNAR